MDESKEKLIDLLEGMIEKIKTDHVEVDSWGCYSNLGESHTDLLVSKNYVLSGKIRWKIDVTIIDNDLIEFEKRRKLEK